MFNVGASVNVYLAPPPPTIPWYLRNNLSYLGIGRPMPMGAGGYSYMNYGGMGYMLMMYILMQQLASSYHAPPAPVAAAPAPPPLPPAYLKQGVEILRTIFEPGIKNIVNDPITYGLAVFGGLPAAGLKTHYSWWLELACKSHQSGGSPRQFSPARLDDLRSM